MSETELGPAEREMLGESLAILENLHLLSRPKKNLVRWQVQIMADKRRGWIGVLVGLVLVLAVIFASCEGVSPWVAWPLIIAGGLAMGWLILHILKIL